MASRDGRCDNARGFPCPNVAICEYAGFGLANHLNRSPACQPSVPAAKRFKRDPEVGQQLFVTELNELVGR